MPAARTRSAEPVKVHTTCMHRHAMMVHAVLLEVEGRAVS